jgi:glucose/arabinose dehydrogenase/cytochrome c5
MKPSDLFRVAALRLAAAGLAAAMAASGCDRLNDTLGGGDDPSGGAGSKSEKLAPGQPKPYRGDLPSVARVNVRDAVLEQLAQGLQYPWAFEFIAPGKLLVTEFAGSMKIFDVKTRSLVKIEGLPEIPSGVGQVGLMDVALHPEFATNGLIYFSHAILDPTDESLRATAVSRAVLVGQRLRDVQRILAATPYGKSPSNFGGALVFDDRGLLYIGVGDRSRQKHAQNPHLLTGKILRLTADGGVPPDNPFVGNAAVDDRIYALGVRNPQGLVFDSVTGMLFETEHGPMGGDEVNVIRAGANYGWPTITYGDNYTTAKIGVGTHADGLDQPLFYYLPSIAVSPIAIYRGAMFREWEGDLLIGALKGEHVSKLDRVDGVIKSAQPILRELGGRVRDIKVAADGSLYFLVQNGGRIYRLYRDSSLTEPSKARSPAGVYKLACASCHSAGSQHIPQLADPAAWRDRLVKGREVLQRHAIEGFGDMPARGFCDNCSDQEIRSAVNYMWRQLQ